MKDMPAPKRLNAIETDKPASTAVPAPQPTTETALQLAVTAGPASQPFLPEPSLPTPPSTTPSTSASRQIIRVAPPEDVEMPEWHAPWKLMRVSVGSLLLVG